MQAVFTTAFICAFASAAAATTTAHRAPLSAYLPKTESAEIALARSAAPASISDHATILTFGPHGYHVAIRGTNGFVCNVERAWANTFDSINFWNPR
ncbi:MAG TPA: hypothetical protein VFL15_06785, partial [Gammaproteobacteria bacterium]|nr:hypothetical protein [Gammaproteobacteria bacterium]